MSIIIFPLFSLQQTQSITLFCSLFEAIKSLKCILTTALNLGYIDIELMVRSLQTLWQKVVQLDFATHGDAPITQLLLSTKYQLSTFALLYFRLFRKTLWSKSPRKTTLHNPTRILLTISKWAFPYMYCKQTDSLPPPSLLHLNEDKWEYSSNEIA